MKKSEYRGPRDRFYFDLVRFESERRKRDWTLEDLSLATDHEVSVPTIKRARAKGGYISRIKAGFIADAFGIPLEELERAPTVMRTAKLKSAASLLTDFANEAVEAYTNDGIGNRRLLGLSSGIEWFDKYSRGLVPGDLSIVTGRSKHDVDWVVNSIIAHLATGVLREQHEESSETKLNIVFPFVGQKPMFRIAAVAELMSKVSSMMVYDGHCTGVEFRAFLDAASELTEYPILLSEGNSNEIDNVISLISDVQAAPGNLLVVIDEYELLARDGGVSKIGDIGAAEVVRKIKLAAQERDAILLVSQRLRGSAYDTTLPYPTVSDLPGGSEVMKLADTVVMCNRDIHVLEVSRPSDSEIKANPSSLTEWNEKVEERRQWFGISFWQSRSGFTGYVEFRCPKRFHPIA